MAQSYSLCVLRFDSMKIRVLGAFGGEGLGHRPSAFLVNDRILVDGGSVTGALSVPEQLTIEHALVSHSHLDHVAGLVYLTETLGFCETGAAVTIAGVDPVVRYRTLLEGVEQRVGDVWVTPVMVNHTVPTSGFVIHDGSTGVIYSADTGPTAALWQAARGLQGLRAVILECAFPNRLATLADIARHLTPTLIRRELDKLPPNVPVWIFHLKPQFHEEIAEELDRLGERRVVLLEQDRTYSI